MQAWRISNYADLSGAGGRYKAGRWNHLGAPIVYCADHPALAMLEILVHLDPEDLPETYRLIEIEIPDQITLAKPELPEGWEADRTISRDAFDKFCMEASSPVLVVPSVIMPRCQNILINPQHELISSLRIVSIEKHPLDPRFIGRA